MDIVPYDPKLAPALAAFYNDLVQGAPHCQPTQPEHWRDFLLPVAEPGKQSPFSFHSRLVDQQVLVAREDDVVLGFTHSAIRRPKKRKGKDAPADRGLIPFLGYAPGHRAAGQALLDAAEAFLRARGIARAHAFPWSNSYPFYHLEGGLSDRQTHVQALFTVNGYACEEGDVFLEWRDFEPVVPPLVDIYGRVEVKWLKARESPQAKVRVEAWRDETNLGICDAVSFAHFNPLTPEPGWLLIDWLGVEKEVEGQGLGRYLLYRALAEMRDAGYRHAAIGASYDNARALLFYSNCGFRIVDRTYGYARDLA